MVFTIDPIISSIKDQDGISSGVLGMTVSGVVDVPSRGRGERDRDNLYRPSQDYMDVSIAVMQNPWYQ